MKERLRQLLHATPFQPFIIRMAHGREYRVEDPDSVLAAPSNVPQIIIEESNGHAQFLSVLLITDARQAA